MKPTIAIIGAGAVGLYYGGRLAAKGLPVHFLLRSDYEAIAAGGIRVRSCDGDFHLPPAAFGAHRSVETMPAADIVLIALKSTSNHLYESLLRPIVKADTTLITLQNGLGNEDALASLFGAERVMGGIAFTCINRAADASVHHTSHGLIRLGAFDRVNQSAASIAELFSSCNIRCQAIPDLMRGRWQKLIWNVPFNGLGAALDLATDELLASAFGTQLVERLMREIMDASAAVGIAFPDADEIVRDQIGQTREMARYRTSMQLDRHHRRPLEHEAIIGEPMRRGATAGAGMPEITRLYDLLCTVNSAISMT